MLEIEIVTTYEECKGCGCSCQHLVIDIYHSPYQDQVAKGTHSGHLSVGNQSNSWFQAKIIQVIKMENTDMMNNSTMNDW